MRPSEPRGSGGPVIGELQRDAEVLGLEEGDDGLEVVAVLAGDAHLLLLDRRLDPDLRVLAASKAQTGRQLLPGRARLLERFQRLPGLAGFGEAGTLEGLLELAPGLLGLALASIDQAEMVMDGRQPGRRLGG